MSITAWVKEHPAEAGGVAAGVALLALLVFHGSGGSSANSLAQQQLAANTQIQLANIQAGPALQQMQDQFALQTSAINAGLATQQQQNQSATDAALLGFVSSQGQQQNQMTQFNDYISAQQNMAQLQAQTAKAINAQNISAANNQMNVYQQLMAQFLPIQGSLAAMQLNNQSQSIGAYSNLGLAQISANQNVAQMQADNQRAQISGNNTSSILGSIGSIAAMAAMFL